MLFGPAVGGGDAVGTDDGAGGEFGGFGEEAGGELALVALWVCRLRQMVAMENHRQSTLERVPRKWRAAPREAKAVRALHLLLVPVGRPVHMRRVETSAMAGIRFQQMAVTNQAH